MPVCGVLTLGVALALILLGPGSVGVAAALGPWLVASFVALYRYFVHSHVTVDATGVTVVNTSTRYQIPWAAVKKIELELRQFRQLNLGEPRFYQLAFTTPDGLFLADAPVGLGTPGRPMAALRNRIQDYRDQVRVPNGTTGPTRPKVRGHAQRAPAEQPATVVEVLGPIRRYLDGHSKIAKIVYIVSLVAGIAYFAVIIGVSAALHLTP
jgi:hypothetical protein